MLFNSDQDQHLLSETLKRVDSIPTVVNSLDYIIKHHSPFALYIATKDRQDCSWIFDPEVVCYMLGGIDYYNSVFESMFVTPQEQEVGIIMFVLRKTGPLISYRLEEELLINVNKELKSYQ